MGRPGRLFNKKHLQVMADNDKFSSTNEAQSCHRSRKLQLRFLPSFTSVFCTKNPLSLTSDVGPRFKSLLFFLL